MATSQTDGSREFLKIEYDESTEKIEEGFVKAGYVNDKVVSCHGIDWGIVLESIKEDFAEEQSKHRVMHIKIDSGYKVKKPMLSEDFFQSKGGKAFFYYIDKNKNRKPVNSKKTMKKTNRQNEKQERE